MGASCSACSHGTEKVVENIEAVAEVAEVTKSLSGHDVVDGQAGVFVDGQVNATELTLMCKSQLSLIGDSPGISTRSTIGVSLDPFQSEPTTSLGRDELLGLPRLGPVGSGGWPVKAVMTEEMVRLQEDTLRLFKEQQGEEMTNFNSEYLTSMTLENYLVPRYDPGLLAKACAHRSAMEDKLTGRHPVQLNGSCRIVGWDGQGRTIIALEPCTMQGSLAELLDHFEYIYWNALDLNKPGVNGLVVVLDVGGGYNWKHFLSMRALTDVVKLLKNCFHGRLAALLLVDIPKAFHGILNTVASFAEPATRKRISSLAGVDALLEGLRQLGVDAPTVDYFRGFMAQRRNREVAPTWNPLVDVPFFLERFPGLVATANLQTITPDHHTQFRQALVQFRLHQWGLPDRV